MCMGRYFVLLGLILSTSLLFALPSNDSLRVKKQLNAIRIDGHIKIDGVLDEVEWVNAPMANNFVQYEQYNGQVPSQQTEVKVLFDDDALYIGANLFDTNPELIYQELGKRDNSDNLKSDAFSVHISTYNDGLNYLQFIVSASGVQTDIKLTADEEERSWNAVWTSDVRINDKGWCVEMRIPYSALRFSNNSENFDWGINFARLIKRHNEKSTWNFVDKSRQGFTTQSGILKGISGIKPPVRLSFSPYLSVYANKLPDKNSIDYKFNGGMDLKLGLSQSFTLDMALIPDFGQVKSDDKVLNLTPYEVKYEEARQFFTEGTELFNKGEIFYSRRIGAEPVNAGIVEDSLKNSEVIENNPAESKMINATKISGRTSGGLGIGFFNAMTQNMYADIKDTITGETRRFLTQGFTNYNMVVLDQTLPHNSFVSVANTNLLRPKNDYTANVTATQFTIRDKKNRFAVEGTGALSQIHNDSVTYGGKAFLAIEKTSGNFKGDIWTNIEGKNYNPNDMGYLQSPNEFSTGIELSHQIFEPFWRFVQFENEMEFIHQMLYSPRNFTNQYLTFNSRFTTKRQFTGGIYIELNPRVGYDYYEPRVEGYKLKLPTKYFVRWFGSPDYRKTIALDHNVTYWKTSDYNQYGYSYSISPRIRFSDKVLLILGWEHSLNYNNIGFFSIRNNNVIMGKRDIETFTNTINFLYTFNSKSFLNLNLRHYVRHFYFSSFYNLNRDGSLTATENPPYSSVNYNLFNIDLLYQWNFAPGSELVLVWKNSIEERSDRFTENYLNNAHDVIVGPQYNSISFKILYYIDYQMLRKHKK